MARPVELREISNEEGNRLLQMVRRGAGNIVTWRRTQIVLWAGQGITKSFSSQSPPRSAHDLEAGPQLGVARRRLNKVG